MEQRTITDRRAWLAGVCAAAVSSCHAKAGFSDESAADAASVQGVDEAVSRGVDYLLAAQRPDGAVADRAFEIAMTSLAIMAMSVAGVRTADDSTNRGPALRKAIDFVLNEGHQDERGYFGGTDSSRMYGHGITTWMLGESLKLEKEPQQKQKLRQSLIRAIDLIIAAQSVAKTEMLTGGWRYTPASKDSDLSVSVWQSMALRSAKDNGVEVPDSVIEKSLQYLTRSYVPTKLDDLPQAADGGFAYTPALARPTFAMTAAGLCTLQLLEQTDSPMSKGASDWLLEYQLKETPQFLFYAVFHYAKGMHRAGGKYSQTARNLVPNVLLGLQQQDGSWLARSGTERNAGKVYCTALAILSLRAAAKGAD